MAIAPEVTRPGCSLQIKVAGIGWQPITDPEVEMTRDECWDYYLAHRSEYPAGTEFSIGGRNWRRDGDHWRLLDIFPPEQD